MHRSQVSLYTFESTAYGLTFFLKTYKEMKYLWHDGGISTFGSRITFLPEQRTAVIVVFNRWFDKGEMITNSIFDQLLHLPKQKAKPPIIDPDRSLWSNYCGAYIGFWHGLAQIDIVDDQLILKKNNEIIPLQAVHQDLYVGYPANKEIPISIGFPSSTKPAAYIYVNCYVHIRTEITTQPDSTKWKSYEGVYTRKEHDTYTVRIVEDELRIHSKEDKLEIVMELIDATRFSSRWSIFEFVTDDHDKVSAVLQGPDWIYKKV